MPSVTLPVRLARRVGDPLSHSDHAIERYVFFVPVRSLPTNLATGPAPRSSRRWDVYKQVRASLLDQEGTPGTFHLKNRGITIIARGVEKDDEHTYDLDIADGQGIIDGAETYAVIREALRDREVEVPAQQFVRVEVITRLPEAWVAEVSGALNASIRSQADTTRHLAEALGWLREELRDRRYFGRIAWSEEERGEVDVKELLCILTCFNTASYPNSGSNHPVVAYDNRPVVLSSFEHDVKADDGRAYRRLQPIAREILTLHDVVQSEYPAFQKQSRLPSGNLIESSPERPFPFVFLGTSGTERLLRGALYPILGAFRWLVEDDPDSGNVRWRGGFENVLRSWRSLAPRFVQVAADRLQESGGNGDLLGKSASHWGMLHREVALAELMAAQSAQARTPPAPTDEVAADHHEVPAEQGAPRP